MSKKNQLAFPSVNPTQTRIKKIIQSNKEIGKLTGPTPSLVSQLTQNFITTLIEKSSRLASSAGHKNLTAWHL